MFSIPIDWSSDPEYDEIERTRREMGYYDDWDIYA